MVWSVQPDQARVGCGQTMASGATHAPVAPRSLACEMTSRNSCTPGCGQLSQAQVLDHDDAVLGVERLRDDERLGRVLRGHRAIAPRVAAGQRDPLLGQPPGQAQARAWLTVAVPSRCRLPTATPSRCGTAPRRQHATTGRPHRARPERPAV